MFGRFPRRTAALVLVLGAVASGCGGGPPEPSGPESLPASGTPQVTPQPREIERVGDDLGVTGKVEVVVDPVADGPTRELAEQVLRMAGADEVVVREPGERAEDASLRVRIGDSESPSVVRGLQAAGRELPEQLGPEGYALAATADADPQVVIGAQESAGAYYGVQTLRQLTSPGRIAGVAVQDSPKMPVRGAIEGFYGPPWSHQDRLDQLAFYGDAKLNSYVYAPKDDPYHRERWREPYPEPEFDQVRDLIAQAGRHHVKFTFALSPGTSICYSDDADVRALLDKLEAVRAAGVHDFSIPLDDISYTSWNCAGDERAYGPPSQEAAGRAQADLLNRVQREFVDAHPDVSPLQTVSTEYSDLDDSPYKQRIREQLDERVLMMWTGDGVIPERITTDDARAAEQVWGRRLLLWDNYPVNDFDGSEGRLMLGPYAEREPGLGDELAGDVVNPMNQAAASKVVELGAADFAWNDEDFDPQRAWRAAADYLAGQRFAGGDPGLRANPDTAAALLVFFDLEHMAPVANGSAWLPPAPELAGRLDEFRSAWEDGDRDQALRDLDEYAQRIATAPERIRAGAPADFVAGAEPWLRATDLWGDSLLATTAGLRARADGNAQRADGQFARAGQLADRAGQVRTDPEASRPQGPVRVADGVLDVFIAQAPQM
ncbi:beta-N-acetylglucosaminidase domain-containing protein [Saccharopolyspora sp. HNM0983]|uniref:Beta-N-acetylglucosaminidase domain-containing protein n=1 Tax=Saccharopolyspora montiporae TaxID=2781240 RepID=A0A929B8C7_9PSEU|nr:beta-N-acetylglucosaminidase domain-containing protein [Saccharopolyspora sp. HNM0983]MBE9374070.1 beta-N-acetylglucosaminidase domain-containing protein [Saccharopolyspora sp. HNM0983]